MEILITGSVAFDYLMKFPGFFRDHILPDRLDSISLSFLVESMVRLKGGVAPNIAYSLALLGERPRLWAAVGEDFEDYRDWLDGKGIDTSGARVIPGVFTASFFVNTDLSNAQIASFYPGAMAFASQLTLKELEKPYPDLILICPNDPVAMNQYVVECQELGIPYIYDPSQQIVRLTDEDLRRGIRGSTALFVNDYEFGLILKMTGLTDKDLLDCLEEPLIVVTRGDKGASIYTKSNEISIPVVNPKQIADPTGIGDAFRGGFLTGYSKGLDLLTCGQMGALAATYCIENPGPQGYFYTPDEFLNRFRGVFQDSGSIEKIISGRA